MYLGRGATLVFGMSFLKFMIKLNGGIFSPILPESYGTNLRAMGISVVAAAGRIAGSISPFIIFPIYNYDNYLAFGLYSVLLSICFIFIWSYPYDLTAKEIDFAQ
jgi:hypothetical protein